MSQVRCNGLHPCRNCQHSGLSCTFNKPLQKKGPKGSRAKVISELRESQSMLEPLHSRDSSSECSATSSTPTRTPALLSAELIEICASFYLAHFFPTLPILPREDLHKVVLDVDASDEAYCLVSSLCAFVIIQPGPQLRKSKHGSIEKDSVPSIAVGFSLLDETIRVRRGFDYIEQPSVSTVMTSFFLSGCYFGLLKNNTSWFYLRECTTILNNLGFHEESSYNQSPSNTIDDDIKRRLFWLLIISER